MRELLKGSKKPPPVVSIADEVANLSKSKLDEESDQDDETELVIEMPVEDDDKEKVVESRKGVNVIKSWLTFII